ncbi:hypothetical protein LEA_14588, partial [human gut metagenome]
KKIEDEVHYLNDSQFTQEPLALNSIYW